MPRCSVLRRCARKKDSSPGEGSRQVFWLVPTATPSQFHHGISGLRHVAVRLRDLQQRELLPIFTAFPFDRVPTRRCRCEPLRCKVTKYSGMGADIPNKIVIFAFAVCEDCVHTTKKRIGFFLTRETWKISNAVRNKS